MKSQAFYRSATWALLFLNVSLIAVFLFSRPGPPVNRADYGFLDQAIAILDLDDDQRKIFLGEARRHSRALEEIDRQQSDLLKPYFFQLTSTAENVDEAAILDQVQALERRKINVTYQHFQKVKEILKEEQAAYFEDFMSKALDIILLDLKKNPE